MPLILQHRIYRADLRANPDNLYVFGDNEARVGLGGQAREMRGEPNAVGIATLRAPGIYWSEDRHEHQCQVIDRDVAPLYAALRQGRTVVFPLDSVGTGLADLERQAPSTFAYLQSHVENLKKVGAEACQLARSA